jgi:hypothetical protein
MGNMIQVFNHVGLIVVAIWLFAATREPLQFRASGRPVRRGVVIAIRVTAVLVALLALVALLVDVFR